MMETQESRTVGGWLREAAFIQRNAAWQGWRGAMRFIAIRNMLREQVGISAEAFENWMVRINTRNEIRKMNLEQAERNPTDAIVC